MRVDEARFFFLYFSHVNRSDILLVRGSLDQLNALKLKGGYPDHKVAVN